MYAVVYVRLLVYLFVRLSVGIFRVHISGMFLQCMCCDRFSAWSCPLKRAVYNTPDNQLYIPFIHSRHNAKDRSLEVGHDISVYQHSLECSMAR